MAPDWAKGFHDDIKLASYNANRGLLSDAPGIWTVDKPSTQEVLQMYSVPRCPVLRCSFEGLAFSGAEGVLTCPHAPVRGEPQCPTVDSEWAALAWLDLAPA